MFSRPKKPSQAALSGEHPDRPSRRNRLRANKVAACSHPVQNQKSNHLPCIGCRCNICNRWRRELRISFLLPLTASMAAVIHETVLDFALDRRAEVGSICARRVGQHAAMRRRSVLPRGSSATVRSSFAKLLTRFRSTGCSLSTQANQFPCRSRHALRSAELRRREKSYRASLELIEAGSSTICASI